MDLTDELNEREQRRMRKDHLFAKGVDNITSGYNISMQNAYETALAKQRRRLSRLFKGATIKELQASRDAKVQAIQKVIFQNQAQSPADYKHDPSRSRQINQTRNFTSKAPLY